MRTCPICLEESPIRRIITRGPTLWNTKCCKIYVHYHCQVQYGNECIICKQQLKCVSSTRYRFVPDYPELTQEEIEENRRAMELIERRRQNYIPLLAQITRFIIENADSDSE